MRPPSLRRPLAGGPLFGHYGIQLRTPEAGGRVNFGAEDHEQTMMVVLALQSKREITRTRIRVRTAMAAQTREQDRYLGGQAAVWVQLADAGPHPDRAHAAWVTGHRLGSSPDACGAAGAGRGDKAASGR